jgi:cytochrome c-type biogenesis protein CcmH
VLAAVLLFFALLPLAAQIPGQSEKARKIGGRLMCMCGCNQVLTECNHVGCSMSTAMLKELDERIARNEPEDLVIQSFIQEYGEKVLAQPPAKNFGLLAWVMPFVATLVGLLVIRVVLLRWKGRQPAIAGVPGAAPDVSPEFLARARFEADLDDENPPPPAGAGKA